MHDQSALKAGRAGRSLAALALVATLLPWATIPPPARAEHEAGHEPVARLQLFLKEVYIYDDHDPGWFLGAGELHLNLTFPAGVLRHSFSGSGGNTVPLDRLALPNHLVSSGHDASQATGFPVYAGETMGMSSFIEERDSALMSGTDYLGVTRTLFGGREGWGVGTHTVRSHFNNDQGNFDRLGDYALTFEIRYAPVPDLNPTRIRVMNEPGGPDDVVCIGVVNRGSGESGNFWMQLKVGDDVPRNGNFYSGGIPSGEAADICIRTDLPESDTWVLTAIVDERREVVEYNEANNRLEDMYIPRPAVAPGPTPTPVPTQPDLWARGVLVRSIEPGGADGCRTGRNDIAVVVKNEGGGTSTSFVVRVIVDGEDEEARDETVAGLDAGKETEVRFQGVRLRQGLREIEATVDAGKAIAEADEGNNEVKVTVNCRAGGSSGEPRRLERA